MTTICISCGQPMAPCSERPPSMGNANMCVQCVTHIDFPADGSAAYRPKDGPSDLLVAGSGKCAHNGEHNPENPHQTTSTGVVLASATPDNLPPATAPIACIDRDGGTATTPAGGNPFPGNGDRQDESITATKGGRHEVAATDAASNATGGSLPPKQIITGPLPEFKSRWGNRE